MAAGLIDDGREGGGAAAQAQRDRIIDAIGRAAADHGYSGLTLNKVLLYADVSRETYEAHFQTIEQALIVAQDAFFERLWEEVVAACSSAEEWPLKVRAGTRALLASVVETSALARVFAVELCAASLGAAERQLAALERFAGLLRSGRRETSQLRDQLPEAIERGLVGGVASIIFGHLLRDEPQAIPAMEAELVEFLLLPYLGKEEARRVADG